MRKLSLTLLAASTLLIAGTAVAQPGPGPRPGVQWRGGGMMGGNMQAGGVQVRTGGGLQAYGGNFNMRGGNFRMHRWGPRPGPNFRYGRLHRGGFINSFWFAPQFFIGDWQSYGFYAPRDGQRWVRYYDDAYLIDGDGRIMDTRYGVRWDRYGGDWDYQDGIPGYRGEWRDYDDAYDDEDYADMREDMRGGDMRRENHREMRGHGEMMRHPGGPMMPPPGYGPPPVQGGYGYTNVYGGYGGYGTYAYPIVIETVTTSGGGGYIEEVTEEVVRTQHRRAVRPRARCSCAPAPRPVVRRPRPPAGERG